MTNKTIIIPDVHGRKFWRSVLDLNISEYDKIVFLGDYSDPYSHEGISHEDALIELSDIVQFKRDNMDKVILVLGNHELHYFNGEFACSRYSYDNRHKYKELLVKNSELFQVAYEFSQGSTRFICTHAGISSGWMEYVQCVKLDAVPTAEYLNEMAITEKYIPFTMISYYRGGKYNYGSCMWADIDEHLYSEPLLDKIQIFGHTLQRSEPLIKNNMWCLDCRKIFIVDNTLLKDLDI